MKEWYRILNIIKEHKDTHFAMATVVSVKGSAYRHAGAKMLFSEHRGQFGTISAGCLEEDLSYHALEVIDSDQSKMVTYDLRSEDDLSWGQGAGCNGSITLYVEPISWTASSLSGHESIWSEVMEVLDSGEKLACAKSIDGGSQQGNLLFYKENGEWMGHIQDQDAIMNHLQTFTVKKGPFEFTELPDLDGEFIFERYEPKERLLVFGAGPDAMPLVQLASAYDFSVTVIDPRSDRCSKGNFPAADHLIVEHPESFLNRSVIHEQSYVVIMTHSFMRDQAILMNMLHVHPRYVGILGPRKRTERIIGSEVPDWIHSPIGLDIHAEGPEEISISILAELIKARNSTPNVKAIETKVSRDSVKYQSAL